MIKDITIGQYYETESKLHSLDPRVKLVGTFFYIISLFILDNIVSFVIATIFLIAVIKLSKVPFKFMIKGMKAIMMLLMITIIFNLIFTTGEPLVSFVKGERECPPEDCGGIWGYQDLLKLYDKKKSRKRLTEDEEDRLEWYDMTEDFDPEYFDTDYAHEICEDYCD